MENLVDFFAIAEKLECEYRLTRMSDGAQQSVASHSWNMTVMAIVLRPYLTHPVNMERVMKMCALHDLPEAITHDVPLHEQTSDVRAKKHAQESVAVSQITNLLHNDDICNVLDEYEERKSREARLVKAIDVLDTAVQHLCAADLKYVSEYDNNFYWKLFFSDKMATGFDFEPVLRGVFDEIRRRVSMRMKNELGINSSIFTGK